MKAAIAAGHPLTAEAGARVLENGGNAVDSCIAAAFAASVTEGPLTGPAGGGFLLAYVDRQPHLLDCFFGVPSRPVGQMEEVVIDFGDASTQVFHVGEASVAVPGLVLGLEEAHRRFGSVPWRELVEPAIDIARGGVDVSEIQGFLHRILSAILQRDEGGRRIYGSGGRLVTDDYVGTLEAIRDRGAGAVADLVPELETELALYRVVEREPVRTTFRGREVLTTPPPSRGGTIVAHALERLERAHSLDDRAHAIRDGYASAPPARMTSTTHVSVIDENGNAVALSSTLGSGSGVFRGGTQLNNMLGELDVIGDAPLAAGDRLASMMTPTLVLEDGRPRLALGSAGSVRLAGAIAQVTDLVLRGTPLEDAIAAPRIHVDGDLLHLEGGTPDEPLEGWEVVRWANRNLFFGGVAAVERKPDGSFAAAGDPRRGGHGLVV
ncbi:MAG TPA: gamma-glutamyltransferase [Gaiellaceae bacterium]|jgi:gamma-glutamyltranspeptidase/glutathione hydrolase|nr:gamma-glutamyltransferase [Gaiellaceae bacterium]